MARHLSSRALLFVGILVSRGATGAQLKKPLDPNSAQTDYSFRVRPGADALFFHVQVDASSTVTGVSVSHEGQRNPFQTLSSCTKDLPMRLLEGDEKLGLVRHADFNFDGYEDLELLQYVVSVKRTPSCKRPRRTAMLRHDQTQKESVDEVAPADFRTGA